MVIMDLESIRTYKQHMRTTETVVLSKAQYLQPGDAMLPISLCLWIGLVMPLISSDNFMVYINEDNFEEFVYGIFTNLIRVQDSQDPSGV